MGKTENNFVFFVRCTESINIIVKNNITMSVVKFSKFTYDLKGIYWYKSTLLKFISDLVSQQLLILVAVIIVFGI